MVRNRSLWGVLLLLGVFFTAFAIGFFPVLWHPWLYSVSYTFLYFTAVMNLQKNRNRMLVVAGLLFLLQWTSMEFQWSYLQIVSNLFDAVFFVFVVMRLIGQIAKAKMVTEPVIFEAVNGYLFLGLMFSILIYIMNIVDPHSFAYQNAQPLTYNDYIYYGFVTFATLGYGDLIPMTPQARSLAILTTIAGQLYLAVIIALLVGKFASQKSS